MEDDPFVFDDVFRFSLITQGRGKKVLVTPEAMDAVRDAEEKPLGPPRVQTLLMLACADHEIISGLTALNGLPPRVLDSSPNSSSV